MILKVTTGKEIKVAIRDFHHTTGNILRRTIVTGGNVLPTAKVQNVAVNGEIWTGSGTTTKKTFPELSEISYHLLPRFAPLQ